MPVPKLRMQFSLDEPDNDGWHWLPDYSENLGKRLRRAYDLIHLARTAQNPSDYYMRARGVLQPFRQKKVCDEQQLRMQYALALVYAGEQDQVDALTCVDEALGLAHDIGDLTAQITLSYLAGESFHFLDRHADAYLAYTYAVTALRTMDHYDGIPADADLELDLVLRQAWRAWEMGHIPTCMRSLEEAHALRAWWGPEATSEDASLIWLDAQMARVSGHPLRAVTLASQAADLCLAQGKAINAGRMQTILAESALDVVEMALRLRDPHASSSAMPFLWADPTAAAREDPDALLARAMAAARRGLAIAREMHDEAGIAMARLALLRGQRLRAGTGSPAAIAEIEQIAHAARLRADPAAFGRAQTAIGDELAARDLLEGASLAYYRGLLTLQEHGYGGLALWPAAALTHLSS